MRGKSQIKKDFKLLTRALGYLKKYKFKLTMVFILILAEITTSVMIPLITGKIIQDVSMRLFLDIKLSLLGLVITYLISCLILFGKRFLISDLSNNYIKDMQLEVYEKVLNLSMSVFDRMKVGEFISRIQGDVTTSVHIITDQLLNFVITLINIIVLLVVILKINLILALVTVTCFPIIYFTLKYFGNILRAKNKELIHINDQYYTVLQQSLNEIKYVKSLGIKENAFNAFLGVISALKNKQIQISLLALLSNNLMLVISCINNVLVIGLGAYFVMRGSLSIQLLMAFTSYAGQFSQNINGLTTISSDYQQLAVLLKRIFKLVDNDGFEKEFFGNKDVEANVKSIEFMDVFFSYDKNRFILENINLKIRSNELTVITGKNGCGKSTLINLISGLYRADKGNIFIGNVNINELNEKSLRDNVYIMHQQNFIFNRSIIENFKMVKQNLIFEQVIEACRIVDMEKYINSLENGFNTIINENMSNLSGGQKQRIALAMCIVKDTPIILLDEITSALDKESKNIIHRILKEMSKSKIIIVISHDDYIIQQADQILIFDDNNHISAIQ